MWESYRLMFQNYFNFKGRTTRREFWWAVLANMILGIVLGTVSEIVFYTKLPRMIYDLIVLIPQLSMGVRRLHDVGKSGWLVFWANAAAAAYLVATYLYTFAALNAMDIRQQGDFMVFSPSAVASVPEAVFMLLRAGFGIAALVLVILLTIAWAKEGGYDNKWGEGRY